MHTAYQSTTEIQKLCGIIHTLPGESTAVHLPLEKLQVQVQIVDGQSPNLLSPRTHSLTLETRQSPQLLS